MACPVMACPVMAYTVMALIVMAYIVMAYIVMVTVGRASPTLVKKAVGRQLNTRVLDIPPAM